MKTTEDLLARIRGEYVTELDAARAQVLAATAEAAAADAALVDAKEKLGRLECASSAFETLGSRS
jgi:hypothetical protein